MLLPEWVSRHNVLMNRNNTRTMLNRNKNTFHKRMHDLLREGRACKSLLAYTRGKGTELCQFRHNWSITVVPNQWRSGHLNGTGRKIIPLELSCLKSLHHMKCEHAITQLVLRFEHFLYFKIRFKAYNVYRFGFLCWIITLYLCLTFRHFKVLTLIN